MIYLASPYSHPSAAVREQRFREVCRAVIQLLQGGETVFSPIAHSHALAEQGLPTDWSFWERHDRDHLSRCDELVVLMLDGWRESVGVAAELQIAAELGKPIRYLAPGDETVSPHVGPRCERNGTLNQPSTHETAPAGDAKQITERIC